MILESKLKSDGSKLLESWGWLVVHIIQTSKNGWPDTEIYRRGQMKLIEWKRPGEEPRQLQLYRHRKLREQGFEVLIVHYLEDLSHLK